MHDLQGQDVRIRSNIADYHYPNPNPNAIYWPMKGVDEKAD
jgi:hypothetical protein